MNKISTSNATGRKHLVVSEAEEDVEAGFRDAARLTLAVFNQTVAPLMDAEGVRHFMEYASAEAWLQRQREGHRTWLARRDKRVLGVAHVRDGTHLSLLFVDPRQQRQGIARALIATLIKALGVERLTVNASPNAVEAYRRLGFVAQGPEDKKSGIRYTPMLLTVAPPKSPGRTRTTKPNGSPRLSRQ